MVSACSLCGVIRAFRKSGRSICLYKKANILNMFFSSKPSTAASSCLICLTSTGSSFFTTTVKMPAVFVKLYFLARNKKLNFKQNPLLLPSSLFRTQDSPTLPSTVGETHSIQTRPRTHVTRPSLPCGTGRCSTARRGGTPSPSLSLLFLRPSRCSTATSTPTPIHTG